jgi:hypothetical protein
MEQLHTDIVRTEIGGLPLYWAEAPPPVRAALIFRVGRADETLARSGKTHLIEHLALFGVDFRRAQFGGFVDHTRTVFHVAGTGDEVATFLARVSAALHALPIKRLELEKQVLRTEAASSLGNSWHTLMGLRYGAAGFGLVNCEELGLRCLAAQELAEWAAVNFTHENAAVWMTGPPAPGLEIELPRGRRRPPPEPTPLQLLELPGHAAGGRGGITVSFVGERSTALTTAAGLLEERIHRRLRIEAGLIYHVSGTYVPLTSSSAHVTLGADCLDEHAPLVCEGILAELRRLADDGPEADELAAIVDERRTGLAEELSVLATLDAAATNDVVGAPVLTRADLVRELEELTPASIARAASDLLATALVLAPDGVAPQPGFEPYGEWEKPRLEGRRFKRRGRRIFSPRRASRIVLSTEGISMVATKDEPQINVRFADVAAVLRLGPGRMTLVDVDGSWIRLDLPSLIGGKRLEAQIEESLPHELFVPYDDEPGANVLDLAREKLGYRTTVSEELRSVRGFLRPGERVVNMAQVLRKHQRGLLVLTDRRLIHISRARGGVTEEFELDGITQAGRPWLCEFLQRIVFTFHGKRTKFAGVSPPARTSEFVRALRVDIQRRGSLAHE